MTTLSFLLFDSVVGVVAGAAFLELLLVMSLSLDPNIESGDDATDDGDGGLNFTSPPPSSSSSSFSWSQRVSMELSPVFLSTGKMYL